MGLRPNSWSGEAGGVEILGCPDSSVEPLVCRFYPARFAAGSSVGAMGSVCSRRNSPTLLAVASVPVPSPAPAASPAVAQWGRLVSKLLRIRFLRKLWNELGQPGCQATSVIFTGSVISTLRNIIVIACRFYGPKVWARRYSSRARCFAL